MRTVLMLCWVACMAMLTATSLIYITTGTALPNIVIPAMVGAVAGVLALRRRQA